jgi:hypothetical protein
MTRTRIAAVLVPLMVLLATALIAGPAAAEPPGGPPSCWNEFEAYTTATAAVATAYRDCTNAETATALTVNMEIYVCDFVSHCMWATWKFGKGKVTVACTPGRYDWFRSSRMRDKILVCNI